MPFRGEHTLDLDGKAYAILAKRLDDEEASNWSGKSALVESIRFALTGWHRMRLDDEWITRGEGSGEVETTFDTGERILRSREVGRPTKLYFWGLDCPPDKPYFGKEAQIAITKRIGLSSDDFLATCYFEQRQMARLVLAKPEDRMSMVSTWLQLGPLERCEDKARDRVNTLIEQVDAIKAKREAARQRLVFATQNKSRELCTSEHKESIGKWEEAKAVVAKLEADWQENEDRRRAKEIRDEYNELVEEGEKLSEECEALDINSLMNEHDAAREKRDRIATDLGVAKEKQRQLAIVARGEFDGACPIADITCPAKNQINAARDKSKSAFELATFDVGKFDEACTKAQARDRETWEARSSAQRKFDQLTMLRQRCEKMIDAASNAEAIAEPIDTELLRGRLSTARSVSEAASLLVQQRKQILDTIEDVDVLEAKCDEESKILDRELRLMQGALAIFGKNGAQRRVAEEVLGRIEDEANERLSSCGIPLSVRVQWSREGSGLAKACESCGAAFPKSEKVKACVRCGAARGPQLVNKLEFVLSDRSGAAEDLVGIAVQLAASAWLRADRQSDWNVVVIDEAFGQLDASNRRALSHHLADLVSSEQAFVIAHHAQVLDALPGRIQIVRSGADSIVQVVA